MSFDKISVHSDSYNYCKIAAFADKPALPVVSCTHNTVRPLKTDFQLSDQPECGGQDMADLYSCRISF